MWLFSVRSTLGELTKAMPRCRDAAMPAEWGRFGLLCTEGDTAFTLTQHVAFIVSLPSNGRQQCAMYPGWIGSWLLGRKPATACKTGVGSKTNDADLDEEAQKTLLCLDFSKQGPISRY